MLNIHLKCSNKVDKQILINVMLTKRNLTINSKYVSFGQKLLIRGNFDSLVNRRHMKRSFLLYRRVNHKLHDMYRRSLSWSRFADFTFNFALAVTWVTSPRFARTSWRRQEGTRVRRSFVTPFSRREKEKDQTERRKRKHNQLYFRSTSHVNAVISQIANFAVAQR